jgi:hypothetical protein
MLTFHSKSTNAIFLPLFYLLIVSKAARERRAWDFFLDKVSSMQVSLVVDGSFTFAEFPQFCSILHSIRASGGLGALFYVSSHAALDSLEEDAHLPMKWNWQWTHLVGAFVGSSGNASQALNAFTHFLTANENTGSYIHGIMTSAVLDVYQGVGNVAEKNRIWAVARLCGVHEGAARSEQPFTYACLHGFSHGVGYIAIFSAGASMQIIPSPCTWLVRANVSTARVSSIITDICKLGPNRQLAYTCAEAYMVQVSYFASSDVFEFTAHFAPCIAAAFSAVCFKMHFQFVRPRLNMPSISSCNGQHSANSMSMLAKRGCIFGLVRVRLKDAFWRMPESDLEGAAAWCARTVLGWVRTDTGLWSSCMAGLLTSAAFDPGLHLHGDWCGRPGWFGRQQNTVIKLCRDLLQTLATGHYPELLISILETGEPELTPTDSQAALANWVRPPRK